jgi:UDPglucose 6-dehydrogenase
MLTHMVRSGTLRFSNSLAEAAEFGEVHFICVGTPQLSGSFAADTSDVEAAIEALAPLLRRDSLVVGRSTVPVGMAAKMAAMLAELASPDSHVELAWNPEFLREGHAVQDTLRPDRLVVGVTSARADAILRSVYAPILAAGIPYIATDLQTAELAKMAANAFLATKISFINAMADVCAAADADIVTLTQALGHDSRIGHLGMAAGLGYGGGCLPKDLRAMQARADELRVPAAARFLREVDAINIGRRRLTVETARGLVGGSWINRNVAVLGASFKPETDDVRESPALAVATAIAATGARVTAHDPRAADNARALHPELEFMPDVEKACVDADIVLHLTEWPEYREIDPIVLRDVVRQPILLDARNVLPLRRWQAAGWLVSGLGVRTRLLPEEAI